MPEFEDSLLLLRVRSAVHSSDDGALDLEIESQLNYRSIYLSSKTTLSLRELRAAQNSPGNAYGRLLGETVGSNPAVKSALKDADRRGRLRVQLMTQDCECLPLIYWERMELPGWFGAIGTEIQTPFSRFAAVNRGLDAVPRDKVFRLALVAANPIDGLEGIDVASHCASVVAACSELLNAGLMTITVMPGFGPLTSAELSQMTAPGVSILDQKAATAENIGELLESRPHALHIIAHGTYNPHRGFYLLLESDDGHLAACNAAELVEAWDPQQLQFLFLESCQGAVEEDLDPRPHMHSFMQQFVSAGLPGILAMQDFIRMDDARTFAKSFYTNLLHSGSLDEAANAARRTLLDTPDYAWAIPAVMTRLKGGAVWRESSLRAAQRALQEKILNDRAPRSYPRFPLDAIAVSSDSLLKRADERKNDEIVNIPLSQNAPRDLYLGLHEALTKNLKTICILGPYGSAKTRVLEDVFLSEFQNHLEEQTNLMPVLLRLSDCAHGVEEPRRIVARAIRGYLGDVAQDAIDLDDLVELFSQEPILFLIAANDHLGESEQQSGLELIAQFRRELESADHPQSHRYLFTLDQNLARVADLPEDAFCLFIQPMSLERVGHYLRAPNDNASKDVRLRLLAKLRASALFDLAESPWLFAELLGQAKRGLLSRSNTGRAAILARVCDERIAQFAGPSGMRARVEEVLYRIAWEVQDRQTPLLSGGDVFEILAELRGNRDYSLMEFRNQLVDSCHILASCGEDGMRFAYPGFQAYCCARHILRQPDHERDRLLIDITATLGRRSRVEWWSETLYVIAGLWPNINAVLSMILSGSPLHEGDHVFVAARCLHESRLAFAQASASTPTIHSIISALIYRSHPANGSKVAARIKATEYLGPLCEDCAVPHLVSVVLDKLRPTRECMNYEYSGGRLAAIKALLFNQQETLRYLREDSKWKDDKPLLDTVNHWVTLDGENLKVDLQSSNELCASVAAFALGLLKPMSALSTLKRRFFDATAGRELLWSLADSMLELRDQDQKDLRDVVDECLSQEREDRWLFGVYLLAQLGRANGEEQLDRYRPFLEQQTGQPTTRQDTVELRRLKGRSLLTLAELHEVACLARCHEWLHSDDGILSFYALEAIRQIGDETSLTELETLSFPIQNGGDYYLLERARLDVYEDLYWRLAGGLSREVMIPPSAKPGKRHAAAGA